MKAEKCNKTAHKKPKANYQIFTENPQIYSYFVSFLHKVRTKPQKKISTLFFIEISSISEQNMQILVIANSKYFHQQNYTFIFTFSSRHIFSYGRKLPMTKDHTLEQRVEQVKLFTVKSRLDEKNQQQILGIMFPTLPK